MFIAYVHKVQISIRALHFHYRWVALHLPYNLTSRVIQISKRCGINNLKLCSIIIISDLVIQGYSVYICVFVQKVDFTWGPVHVMCETDRRKPGPHINNAAEVGSFGSRRRLWFLPRLGLQLCLATLPRLHGYGWAVFFFMKNHRLNTLAGCNFPIVWATGLRWVAFGACSHAHNGYWLVLACPDYRDYLWAWSRDLTGNSPDATGYDWSWLGAHPMLTGLDPTVVMSWLGTYRSRVASALDWHLSTHDLTSTMSCTTV